MTKYVFQLLNTQDVFQEINTTKLNGYYILKNVKKIMVKMIKNLDKKLNSAIILASTPMWWNW